MKKRRIGNTCLALLLCCVFFTACKKDETEQKQRESIESYITSTLQAEVDEQDGVYLVLLEVDSSGSPRVPIAKGDEVEFEYIARTLDGTVFATSDSAQAEQSGLTPTSIGAVRVGEGALIAGLDRGLLRMALYEQALILFPFTLGYGGEYVGQVRAESALVFQVVVTRVN